MASCLKKRSPNHNAATDAWACLNIYNLLQELKRTGDYEVENLPSPEEEIITNSPTTANK